jgi:hypothetical protein
MRWRRHETIEKSRRLLGFALDGQGVHAREWSGFRGKADIGVVSNALRCVEAANALIRVHKASTQNQKLRAKTSKISMSRRDNRKSCHSDKLFQQKIHSRGMIWGTKPVSHGFGVSLLLCDHRNDGWPQLLNYWGLPNLQVINREVHVTKCTIEARYRAAHDFSSELL